MKVADLIKKAPVTAKPSDKIIDVVKLMAQNNVGSVVLVDDVGRPMGIVTERDLVRGLARGVKLDDPVHAIATMDGLVMAAPGEDLYEALKKMRSRGIRHLIVVDDRGVLRGVVSMRDLMEDYALKRLGERAWWPPPED